MLQSTLKSSVLFEGIGVHSGNVCNVSVLPAAENKDIVFVRKDTCDSITADYENVTETAMCTRLSNFNNSVVTVEHLSAALYGLGISNAVIEMSGEEMPILDGSALQFVQKISAAGIEKQKDDRKQLKVLKSVKVEDGEKWTSFSPAESFIIDIECDFSARNLQTKPFRFDFSKDSFMKEIAPARTFGFFADVEYLRKNNLASGASLSNTVVFDNKGFPLNEEGLRFPNEPIRHKVLDIIGDVSLAQCKVLGNFSAFCPSHKMNNMILRELFSDTNNYEII